MLPKRQLGADSWLSMPGHQDGWRKSQPDMFALSAPLDVGQSGCATVAVFVR